MWSPQSFDGSCCARLRYGFAFGKCLFDRIEVKDQVTVLSASDCRDAWGQSADEREDQVSYVVFQLPRIISTARVCRNI
nr:hypothetical protein Hi04_10k_c4997_00013 [uncultured bacterium]